MSRKTLNLTRGLEVRGEYSNIDFLYGPYTSLEQACQKVDQRVRKVGLTVGIVEQGSVVEYWWRDTTDDNSLILKNPSKDKVDALEGRVDTLEQGFDQTFTLEEKEKLAGIEEGANNTDNDDVEGWGFTKNIGTVTKVRINGQNIEPSVDGLVDLGMVDVVQADSKLPDDYEMSSLSNDDLSLVPGESHNSAFSKLEKVINDDEEVIASALNDLNDRVTSSESAIQNIKPSSTVNIQGHETPLDFHQEYFLKQDKNKDRIPTFEAIGNLLGRYHEYVTTFIPGTNTNITLDTVDQLHSPNDVDRVTSLRALGTFGRSVADRIEKSELVTAAALNDLNERKLDADSIKELDIIGKQIPVLNNSLLEEKEEIPENYLWIREEKDLNLEGKVENNTYTTQVNGTYVDVLFNTVRALQAEVAKLRNSFKYGIVSYQNNDTAFSSVIDDYEETESEEPLWAIDKENLSFIDEVNIDENHGLSGDVNANINGVLHIVGDSVWNSYLTTNSTDSKIIIYIISSNSNIQLSLNNGTINIDLKNLLHNSQSKQKIQIVLSRKVNELGNNYIYINADNYNQDQKIANGYLDLNNNILSLFPVYLDIEPKFTSITLNNLDLYELSSYSKYQDFSEEVIPSKPNEEYKYDVAHIAIRSVNTYEALQNVSKKLMDSELVYCRENRRLYIIDNGRIQIIGGSSSSQDDNDMTDTELFEKLQGIGIVKNTNGKLELSDVSNIVFVNDETNEKFKVYIDAYGNLKTEKVNDSEETLSQRTLGKLFPDWNLRGFVGTLRGQEHNPQFGVNDDFNLWSDRIKIGAIYAPLSTDKVYGCTHAYIELENTSDEDFPLEGCYLHYSYRDSILGPTDIPALALKGKIPKGGTYLIRCKQYSTIEDANTFIDVKTFDQEWYYNNQLLDLTIYPNQEMAFALTYGYEDLSYNNYLIGTANLADFGVDNTAGNQEAFPRTYHKSFIDALYLNKSFTDSSQKNYWTVGTMPSKPNSIYKNTFELDPAKQAFQALTTKDSSRIRNEKAGTDYQQLSLNKEFIEFPYSDDIYPVNKFAPKASFEHKNVCTDKSKLDMDKPNMVTCSFGIDIYKTRCFNWISAGLFDEYVFIKQGNTWHKFESYKEGDENKTQDSGALVRKEFNDANVINYIYKRMNGRFPADNTFFTSHKCIINITDTAVQSPTTYTYVVGRADKSGEAPDFNHCSEEYTFTLYPTSYQTKIYQITDQQGFHWIEYQVWAAAAKVINEQINNENNIIPILINTGDMTQNGTRINEWLDYYNGGKCLFNHLEQMNVVGNNDLCGTNQWKLGTGDDPGKSNSFYFHLFYCYEIDTTNIPIVNNKYIPSLYYFDSSETRFIMVNSELTIENCRNWFNILDSNNNPFNIYTGFSVPDQDGSPQQYVSGQFTPIYDQLYTICNTANNRKIFVACHELPFTVITRESLASGQKNVFRSISKANKLVGSHLNQISPKDKNKGLYWFSRLMEHFNVSLVIGGHKHTYSCTHPVKEYYYYDNGTKNSKDNGRMIMQSTLENDDVTFVSDGKNLTKYPLVLSSVLKQGETEQPSDNTTFYPWTLTQQFPNNETGITYFMCQATGYKLTSNKELPSPYQKFSLIIPQSGLDSKGKDSADVNQKYPMFAIISQSSNQTSIILARIQGILNSSNGFTQINYGKTNPYLEYLIQKDSDNYGQWSQTKQALITL